MTGGPGAGRRDGPAAGSRPDPLAGASPALVFALTARFLLELALLAGVAVLVHDVVPGGWSWPAAILAVAAVATLWGVLLSPRAPVGLPAAASLGIEAVLFAGVGAGLLAVGHGVPAALGVGLWLLDRTALALLRRTP
ncbi:MAG: hypothetical protein BGO96_10320 [Micrococcales bacterium 73-15]|nr:MAG: hypothetical protein BGO96_10320 [Micrococcales bacterium 73-15]